MSSKKRSRDETKEIEPSLKKKSKTSETTSKTKQKPKPSPKSKPDKSKSKSKPKPMAKGKGKPKAKARAKAKPQAKGTAKSTGNGKPLAKGVKKEGYKVAQKFETPSGDDPCRAYYESLRQQLPDSVMAAKWCLEHGLIEDDHIKVVVRLVEKAATKKN